MQKNWGGGGRYVHSTEYYTQTQANNSVWLRQGSRPIQCVSRDAEFEASVFGCHGNERNTIPAGNIPITDLTPFLRRS